MAKTAAERVAYDEGGRSALNLFKECVLEVHPDTLYTAYGVVELIDGCLARLEIAAAEEAMADALLQDCKITVAAEF
jgi:hypothetical protein